MVGPEEARARREASLAVALALFVFYLPLWLGQQLYRRDTWRMLVPCRAYIGERLRAGEFPSWYPYDGLGIPFHAQAVCGVLHPLSWLAVVLRPEVVITVQSLAAVALAAWGTWRLARLLGAAPWGAAVAAVAFALSGYLTSLTANIVYMWGAAMLPVQLWAFASAGLRGWTRGAFAGALFASASTLLMGDIQSAYVFTVAGGVLGLLLARGRRRGYLVGAAVCSVLLAGLSAGQLLPSWELLRLSVRASGLTWEDATYWSLHPLRVPELFLPDLSPLRAPGRAVALFGSSPGYLLWAEALGGSALVSYLAVWGLTDRRHEARVRAVLGGLALVGLLLALGRYGGLFWLARKVLPLMSTFRWPEKLVPLFLAPWAVLAALGWERALAGSWRPRVLAAGALAVLGGAVALGAGAASPELGSWLVDAGRSLGLGAAALLAVAALARVRPALRVLAAFALVLAEVASGSLRAWDSRPLEDSEVPPVAVEVMRSHGVGLGQARAVSFGFDYRGMTEADVGTPVERRQVDAERDGLLALIAGQYGVDHASFAFQAYPPVLASLFGVGTLFPQALAPRLNVAAALVPDDPTLERFIRGMELYGVTGTGVHVYGVPNAWPRAYLAAPRGYAPDRDGRLQLAELPEGQVLVPGWKGPPAPPASGTARITAYAPEEVHIEVTAAAPAVLVLNDLHLPGWSASLGNAPVPIQTVNLLVRGVRVPAGTHEVVFRYEAPGERRGLWVSALSLLATALVLLLWPARWRQAGAPLA